MIISRRSEKRDFLGLDLIRFAAALMVVFLHFAIVWLNPASFDASLPLNPATALRAEPLRWGSVGVQVFFVLSGFVIAYSASNRRVGQFVRNRFLRLYPGAWICATLTLILARWGTPHALEDYGRALILSPVGQWIDYVYWTLPIELAFYLAVAVMLWRDLPIRWLGGGLVLWSASYWLLRCADFATGGSYRYVFRAVDTSLGNLTLLPYGCFFGLGILIWSIKFEGLTRHKLALASIAIGASLTMITIQARYSHSVYPIGSDWRIFETPALWLFSLGLIIASIAFNERVWHALGRWSGPIQFIGLATYPLYLLHQFIGHRIIMAVGANILGMTVALATVMVLAFAVVPVEKRLRKLLYAPGAVN